MGLERYRAKRDFTQTREPMGGKHAAREPNQEPVRGFVIQKHAARRLHYDFRLEMDGVLKSWAVPKGLPTEKGERRLAMEVEDHSIEYGGFEGTIPAGNYGAGTVLLWDFGTYEPDDADPLRAWRKGKLSFTLHGKKLKGHWTLARMKSEDDSTPWLMIKTGETVKKISVRADDTSALSGLTMKQVAAGDANRTWGSAGAVETGEKSSRRVRSRVARK